MAVVTLYFQSLLLVLIGLSNLVQGRSLLLPGELQPVTEPDQVRPSIGRNNLMAKYIPSQSSKPKPKPLSLFEGRGYLAVRTPTTQKTPRPDGTQAGTRAAGFVNSRGR